MTKAMVTSLPMGGSEGTDRLNESVPQDFAEVEVTYTSQQDDGLPARATDVKWDIAKSATK